MTDLQKDGKEIARGLLTDLRQLEHALAVKILGNAGDISRSRSDDHFAGHVGTTSIWACGGYEVHRRLSLAAAASLTTRSTSQTTSRPTPV